MRGMATGLLAGLGLLLGLGAARAAPAGGAGADEEALIREALMMRRRGNDRAAQVELQRAYDLGHSPRAAAQLGFAEQALGMWPQAEAHVGAALRAPEDPWIHRNRATLEQSLAVIRAHVGRVEIVGGAPGAQVTINGDAVGLLPLPDAVAVSAGPVEIEVRTPGAPLETKTVNVAVGEYARVAFAAAAARAPALAQAPARPPVLTPVPPVGAGAAAAPPLARTERPDEGRGRRTAGIGLVAGGLAAVGGGVAASLAARHKFDAINADAAAGRPYDESNGNWKTYQTAAAALYVV
ncbi:MAG TPA: hypothetical protein VIF57_00390, partial [Polyangia bacterium]